MFTIAVGASPYNAAKYYNISNVSPYVDYFFLMTYDYTGTWAGKTGHNAPLDEISSTVSWWISQGAPRGKLVLGLAAYGRSFTLSNPSSNGVGAPIAGAGQAGPYTKEAGSLSYMEVCLNLNNGWTRVWDSTHQVPYAYNGNQWVSYDNPQSIRLKVNFLRNQNLAGAMWWTIADDDFRGIGGNGSFPLIRCSR